MNKNKRLNSFLDKKDIDALVIFGNSYENSNLFYLSNFLAPDPFLFFKKINEDPIIVVSSMELERAKKSSNSRVKELNEMSENSNYYEVIESLFKKFNVEIPGVDYSFPFYMAKKLKDYSFSPVDVSLIRRRKNKNEIKKIKKAQEAAEAGIMEVKNVLQNSEIRDNKLFYKGDALTSEYLHQVVEEALLKKGAECRDLIISSGKNSAVPHHSGEGKMDAGPIIVDVFPKLKKERYCGDITRTFSLKKDQQIEELYKTVHEAQKTAFDELESGKETSKIDEKVKNYFRKKGFGGEKGEKDINFSHSTGHGVGLNVHESPSISINKDNKLKKGDVVTIEPGLYNSQMGGVRIEDLVVIKEDGFKNLTSFEKNLYP